MLKPLLVPKWKWDEIAMDFILSLPRTSTEEEAIWVVMGRLTKITHFLPIKVKDPMEKLTRLYIQNVVRPQGVTSAIVSEMWTKLKLTTTFHPQIDGQLE
jgi:hypothetical protein